MQQRILAVGGWHALITAPASIRFDSTQSAPIQLNRMVELNQLGRCGQGLPASIVKQTSLLAAESSRYNVAHIMQSTCGRELYKPRRYCY